MNMNINKTYTIDDLPNSWKLGFWQARNARMFCIAPHYSKKIGAALFNGNKLVSIGYNLFNKTHTFYSGIRNFLDHDKCVHAEMTALVKRQYHDDSNLILYIYREHLDGTIACAKPCSICMTLIKLAGVKRIRYTDLKNKFVEEKI
jgi:deoxycytidylate deaminase